MAVNGRLEFIDKEMYVEMLLEAISAFANMLQQAHRKANQGHPGQSRGSQDGGMLSSYLGR
jgi:hypothetical protein